MVTAADEIGAGACVSIAVLDPSSGALLAEEQVHTSGNGTAAAAAAADAGAAPGADPERRCAANITAALDSCASEGDAPVGNSTCCVAMSGLSKECVAEMQLALAQAQDEALQDRL